MRILLVDRPVDCASMKIALVALGHHVELVDPSVPNTLSVALQQRWDIVIVEWLASTPLVEAFVALAARGEEPPAHIVCAAKATPAMIEAAFKDGAEDFLHKPLVMEHLRGRVERVAYQKECLAAAVSQREMETRAATAKVTVLQGWTGFERLAAAAASGVTLVPLTVTRSPAMACTFMASTMLLSIASDHLECRVVVDGDQKSLETLAGAAVGATDPAAIADLIGEIANNAGGAFMRCALEEAVLVTSGIPVAARVDDVERQLAAVDHSMVCWLTDSRSGAQLRIRLAVRVRRNAFVRVGALREGMVLVSDLKNTEGAVLLTAGTRVTLSTSERVRKMLDARRIVEVADAAA